MNSSFFIVSGAAAVGFFTLFTKFRFQHDNKDTKSSSSLSVPSPSTSVSRIWKHHVFPSFHGADVRTTILSHILESFRRKGIDTFIDNNIERSKSIGPELKEAIRGSKIAIVLLSKNYASSSWCLDELAEIINCREVSGQIVMTVFYEVDPTDIKKQTGDFGKAFRKTCKGKTKEHIERWRNALVDVATIAGEHSRNWRNEAAMIEKIATDVSNMLNSSIPSRYVDGLVGMRAHMERIEPLLRLDDLDEVRMIGIWGPPGIGKTTIARVMFDQFSSRFQHGAIMVNIKGCYPRPCLDEYSAQLQLQQQMLSEIIDQKDITIRNLGVAQERLKDKKVFLVLDEVDQSAQLEALAKETQWFGPGSRIIITTEDLRVLKAHGINHIYKVDFPSSNEAFQIFCMNAFGQKHPYEGFYELARKVTNLAGDLPLGLKVLGSALNGMSKLEWERTLPKLKTRLDGKIGSIINFSYDALYDEEKHLFLYIACLFNHEPIHRVEEILANKFLDVRQGLQVLVEKSLISINYGYIQMETLLEQFGRETSRKQFVHLGFTKRQLLVDERDIREVLNDDTIDNIHFIGINLYLSKTEEKLNISEKALERMNDFQFIRITSKKYVSQPERLHLLLQHSQKIRTLDWSYFQNICDDTIDSRHFIAERLHSLLHHSQKIRLLDWSYFQNICMPSTFNPEFLVQLVMRYSKLQKLWEGTKQLRNLKWMDLSYSEDLKELPDLSTATNLEELSLKHCSSLVKIPTSYCSYLVKLPSIGNATKLEELDLSDCSSLVKLPPFINPINLRIVNLENCSSLVKLPSSIGDITNLKYFYLSNCSNLVELPSSIGNLKRLSVLLMRGCSKLETLPTNINLESLLGLDLADCSQLKSFPEISTNITHLRLDGTAIKEVPLSIMSWPRPSTFSMSYFESLNEFSHALDMITDLHLVNEDIQEVPPWVKGMSRLRKLRLYNCNNLVSLPQLSDSVSRIVADNCQSLESLDCSFNNPDIELKFIKCFNLNQEARDLIIHTSFLGYAILPGTQVPACFNHRATTGGSLKIKLNESPLPTSLRFKACIILIMDNEETDDDDDDKAWTLVNINIMDKQKDPKVQCMPSSRYIDIHLTEHIHTFEVVAKEVTSTELVFEFTTDSSKWKIGECGILQILEDDIDRGDSEDGDEEDREISSCLEPE